VIQVVYTLLVFLSWSEMPGTWKFHDRNEFYPELVESRFLQEQFKGSDIRLPIELPLPVLYFQNPVATVRGHYDTSRQVAGSIPDEVIGFFS
jgi:hypothetical protein